MTVCWEIHLISKFLLQLFINYKGWEIPLQWRDVRGIRWPNDQMGANDKTNGHCMPTIMKQWKGHITFVVFLLKYHKCLPESIHEEIYRQIRLGALSKIINLDS